ncbi:MAG: DUF4159 domain-containing protein [Phycisphaerae bacterium]|nr:DUF4159 domain-containing protein [Phycisphaerae bacterium]
MATHFRGSIVAAILVGLILSTLPISQAQAAEDTSLQLPGHGIPPKAKPHRRSGGESFPPLPLPATPLRRSERKREPAPPALVSKMAYTNVTFAVQEGKRRARTEWLNVTDDVRNLLQWTNRELGIRYRHFDSSWRSFSYDPTEIPILYLTGHEPLPTLSDDQRSKIRRYVYDGGTIFANACCGEKKFTESFRREIAAIFPKRELAPLASDHPVFSAFYDIKNVQYQQGTDKRFTNAPYIEGMNIGCRTAVFFSPIDLANGWFGQNPPPNFAPGAWIVGADARKLGSNMVTYTIACHEYGRMRAVEKVFFEKAAATRDEFVLAQVVHAGDWDPTPSGLPNLLKFMQDNTTLQTQFKREIVSLGQLDVFKHPMLYMTGQRDFKLNDAEVARLRTYLDSGGVLVADAAAGRKSFDVAFRREIKRVLPKDELGILPLEHPIYSAVFPVRQVGYTDLVKQESPNLSAPALEGVTRDGSLCVIYSRFSLGNGWEQLPYPYNRGYVDADALKLGINLFVYGMTH